MTEWSFLTNHARVLLCIAHDPGVRLREIAARTGVTERTAYGIVTDLTEAGYVVKHKDGRRNRYQIQAHLPLPETDSRKRTIGEILALLTSADDEATITPTCGLCRSARYTHWSIRAGAPRGARLSSCRHNFWRACVAPACPRPRCPGRPPLPPSRSSGC